MIHRAPKQILKRCFAVVQGHSTSSIDTSRNPVCYFLLMTNRIPRRFKHIATQSSEIYVFSLFYLTAVPFEALCRVYSFKTCVRNLVKQELSYRKQITRQLRRQYVEGIYRPKYYTVTLKSKLRDTQGHRNGTIG